MHASISILVATEDLPDEVNKNKTMVEIGDLKLYFYCSSGHFSTMINIGPKGELSESLVKALDKINLKYQVRIDAIMPLKGSAGKIAEGKYVDGSIQVQVWKLDLGKYTNMLVNAKEPVFSIKLIGDDLNSAIAFYRSLLQGKKKPESGDSQ